MKYLIDQEVKRAATTNVVRFNISHTPIPLKRPRFYNGNVYDSQKQEKFAIGLLMKRQYLILPSLLGKISMDITFYFPISRAASKIKKQKMLGTPNSNRPDLSNCIKFYEDVMQDIRIFKDDAQIVEINARKLYDGGNGPRVEITLREI